MKDKVSNAQTEGLETEQDLINRVLARETKSEKKERALLCSHGETRSLCLRCAGLAEDRNDWGRHRTREQRISRKGLSLHRYSRVKLSSADTILVSRPDETGSIGPGAKREAYAAAEPARRHSPSKVETVECSPTLEAGLPVLDICVSRWMHPGIPVQMFRPGSISEETSSEPSNPVVLPERSGFFRDSILRRKQMPKSLKALAGRRTLSRKSGPP